MGSRFLLRAGALCLQEGSGGCFCLQGGWRGTCSRGGAIPLVLHVLGSVCCIREVFGAVFVGWGVWGQCVGAVPDPSTEGLWSAPRFLPLAACSCLLPRHSADPCASSEARTPTCEIPSPASVWVRGLSAGREGAWVFPLTLRGKACDLALVTLGAQELREKMQDAFRSCVFENAWVWQCPSIVPTLVFFLCFSLCCPCSLSSSVECPRTHEGGGRGHPLFPCFVPSLAWSNSELIGTGGCCLR